jgi:hypothetical protein
VRSSATDEKINEKQGKKTFLSQVVSRYNNSILPSILLRLLLFALLLLLFFSLDSAGPKIEKAQTKAISTEAIQLSIFETVDPIAGQLKSMINEVDLNTMTPIDCMLKLRELKNLIP